MGTTGGQRNEWAMLLQVRSEICLARAGPGRPRTRPDAVLADSAYTTGRIRAAKQWRGLATRYDKLALTYRAAATISAIRTWLRI
jgi:hypothetical protein